MRSEEGEDIFCPAVPRIGRGQTVLWIYLERARDSWYPPYNATLQAQRNCWCHLTHIIQQQHVSPHLLVPCRETAKSEITERLTFLRSQGQTSLLHFWSHSGLSGRIQREFCLENPVGVWWKLVIMQEIDHTSNTRERINNVLLFSSKSKLVQKCACNAIYNTAANQNEIYYKCNVVFLGWSVKKRECGTEPFKPKLENIIIKAINRSNFPDKELI